MRMLLVLLAVGLTLTPLCAADPVVNEKPLSVWIKQLGDADADKHIEAARAIAKVGPDAADAAGALCEALKEPDGRWLIQHALVKIGPRAIPAVEKLLGDPDRTEQAFDVLLQIG